MITQTENECFLALFFEFVCSYVHFVKTVCVAKAVSSLHRYQPQSITLERTSIMTRRIFLLA